LQADQFNQQLKADKDLFIDQNYEGYTKHTVNAKMDNYYLKGNGIFGDDAAKYYKDTQVDNLKAQGDFLTGNFEGGFDNMWKAQDAQFKMDEAQANCFMECCATFCTGFGEFLCNILCNDK
jgi:hypothetical protein